MDMALMFGVGTLIWVDVALLMYRLGWREGGSFYYYPFAVACFFSVAVYFAVNERWVLASMHAVYTAMYAWIWWHKHRRRRRRMVDAMAWRVKVAGSRLVLHRPAAGQLEASWSCSCILTSRGGVRRGRR